MLWLPVQRYSSSWQRRHGSRSVRQTVTGHPQPASREMEAGVQLAFSFLFTSRQQPIETVRVIPPPHPPSHLKLHHRHAKKLAFWMILVKSTSVLTIACWNPKAHGVTLAEWVPNVEVYNVVCPMSNYNEGFSSDFLVMKRSKEP